MRDLHPPPEWEDFNQPLNEEELQIDNDDDIAGEQEAPVKQNLESAPAPNQTYRNANVKAKVPNYTSPGKNTKLSVQPQSDLHKNSKQISTSTQKPANQQKHAKTSQGHANTQPNIQKQEPQPSTSTETADNNITNQGTSKLFSVDEIDRLISSKRGNGKLYYYVKWKDPQKSNTWEFASSIPSVFIREFHANRTMSGRKRKRALQNHKFFDKLPTVQSMQSCQIGTEIIGYRETYHRNDCNLLAYNRSTQKSYNLDFLSLPKPKRKPHIIPYLDKMFKLLKEHVPKDEWSSKQGILDDGETFEAKMVRESHTCDLDDFENTTYFKVFKLGSNKPVWLTIHQVPPLCLRHFLFRLRSFLFL